MRRSILRVVTVILFGITVAWVWATLTHRVSYVVTNGISMQPLYHADDLVVVVKKDSYRVGDIVAYHSGDITVLHRIIDRDAAGFVTQGDNNESVDPMRPSARQLIGRAVLHIPAGGTWLRRATSAPILAAIAFVIAMGAGRTAHQHRRRRRATVRKHSKPSDATGGAGLRAAMAAPRSRVVAGVIAGIALLGAVFGGLAWTRPPMLSATVPGTPIHSMTFAYVAEVPPTPAYDGTIVTSPNPLFRKVVKVVDVTFDYAGPAGRVEVNAELSLGNGWHSTVPLNPAESIVTTPYRGTVRLDLDALEAHATAGAKATGVRSDEIAIVVVPRFTGGTGAAFAPALLFKLTPLLLTVTASQLVQHSAAPPPTRIVFPQVLRVGGHDLITVATARVIAITLLLSAILAAVGFLAVARRTEPPAEAERIRRQYGPLLVEVEPMAPPPDRPVVRVTEIKTLARLAERYGLFILHWSTGGSQTYAVQDDTVAYCYSTGPTDRTAADDTAADHTTADDTTADDEEAPAHWQFSMTATNDHLTHLAGRSLFEEEMRFALGAGGGERICLMLIDVDDLAGINEQYGREAGDLVLAAVAERLRRAVRPRDLVARLQSDDFAVLFEDVAPEAVDGIAKRIMRIMHESVPVLGHQVRMRASLGIAPASSRDATLLMEQAAAALAEAKVATDMQYAWFAELTEGGAG